MDKDMIVFVVFVSDPYENTTYREMFPSKTSAIAYAQSTFAKRKCIDNVFVKRFRITAKGMKIDCDKRIYNLYREFNVDRYYDSEY